MKLDLLANSTVVDDAMRFIEQSKEKLISEQEHNSDDKESKEHDYDEEEEPLEEIDKEEYKNSNNYNPDILKCSNFY